MAPLSLYVHIPFCIHKCGYCDFNSYALDTLREKGHIEDNWAAAYGGALTAELQARTRALDLKGRSLKSIFFGGGTPSLFPPEETGRILETIRRLFALPEEAEITVEANPGAADAGRFGALREMGVNRISIGVQTFDDAALRRLDRVHTGDDARAAFHAARAAGFENISLDLMFGIPLQDLSAAKADLASAIALGPEHLSAYELTVEPGTAFHAQQARGELAGLPGEDTALAMWELRDKMLADAGYERYEISNFARPGFACRHNLNYWHRGEYLGIGAGAHSLIGDRRAWNIARPDHYIENAEEPAAGGEEISDPKKSLGEALMLGLRLREGVSLDAIGAAAGTDPESIYGEMFEKLTAEGLLERERGRLRLTPKGTLLANRILAEFL